MTQVFDRQGELMRQHAADQAVPTLASGDTVLAFTGDGAVPVEVTVTLIGPGQPP